MLVGTWSLYLFLWKTQFLLYCALLNQARLFNQPDPASWCQEGTARLQLCRGGGQTENSTSFLVAGVKGQLYSCFSCGLRITFQLLFVYSMPYNEWASENTVNWMIVGMLLAHEWFLTVILALFQTSIALHSLPFVSSHPLWGLLAFPCTSVWYLIQRAIVSCCVSG